MDDSASSGRTNILKKIIGFLNPSSHEDDVTEEEIISMVNEGHEQGVLRASEAGVKRIRIHDLRHSHISLLIDMGFSAVAIADRVGHESIDITYNYAHLFPSKQAEMASKLNMERSI